MDEAAIIAAISHVAAQAEPKSLMVHPDNVTAVKLFDALRTQWNLVALSTMERSEIRRTGLRYEVLKPVARLLGLKLAADDFTRLQLMEAEALVAWAEASA